MTFLDLFDEINIEVGDTQSIKYTGPFKPVSNIYENDIIIKTLDSLKFEKNIKLNISNHDLNNYVLYFYPIF